MANRLKMARVQTILTLRSRGWSFRRIARELGVHRETAARYVGLCCFSWNWRNGRLELHLLGVE